MIAAISLMVVTATGAQAEAKLRVEGKVLAEGEKVEIAGSGGLWRFLVPGLGLTIHCTSADFKGTTNNTSTDSHGTTHILYHGCTVVGNKFCQIYPTSADRAAKTNAGLLLATGLSLTGGSLGRRILRWAGLPFATIYYTIGGGCALPSQTEVSGSIAFEISSPSTESISHGINDISEADEKTFGVALFYGKEPATFDEGNVSASLLGAFLNKKWSLD
jgi:hypothetical protein